MVDVITGGSANDPTPPVGIYRSGPQIEQFFLDCGLNMSIGLVGPGGTCTFTGTLSQAGQFGAVAGTYSCGNGDFGTFQFFEMSVGVNYLTGRLSANGTNDGCKTAAYFAAVRHGP